MNGTWLKLYVDSAFVHWTGELPNSLFGAWIKLLCVTKEAGVTGVTLRVTALQWLKKSGVTAAQLRELVASSNDHITDDGEIITIRNWWEYQEDSKNAERQKRFREKHRNVTLPLRNTESRVEESRVEESKKQPSAENNSAGKPKEDSTPTTAAKKPTPRTAAVAVVADKPTTARPGNPYADAFKAAFDDNFPEKYKWQAGDFVQLDKFRKDYPDVWPDRFVAVAQACWAEGRYAPPGSLTIRGLCAGWAQCAAKSHVQNETPAQRATQAAIARVFAKKETDHAAQ